MNQQAGFNTEFTGNLSHLHLDPKSCPTCGQEIPPDKLEEIGGRIAATEREQTLAITAQLEKQFATEKARADAKAKADLESEREQSAMREARVRDEAQKSAERLINEKLAEADRARADLEAGWGQQLARAESAQRSAEQMWANLQAEMNDLRTNSASAVEAIKTEAKEREIEIRTEATRTAEAAAAERVAAIEAAQREFEVGSNARINEAEASRIAAEQKERTLAVQLDELRSSNQAEVARVREEAGAELLRTRQVATEEAETRFRDALAAGENALAEASTKSREAEAKVLTLMDQHAAAIEASLNSQREVLEKAKDDAVNSEKARAFEESLKLSNKVTDLQRALENKTAEELGEGAEINLFESLKKEFPEDDIHRTVKGAAGADILHSVMLCGKKCGTIIYDSKDHNQFRNEHVSKLRADQLAAGAEHAILATRKLPQGARQLHLQDGVLLANPARVVLVATLIRQHLLQLHALRVSNIERDSKTTALYDFIVSERCSSLLARIDERADDLLEQQSKEVRWHENNWKRQGEAIRAIQKAKADLGNQVHLIIGTSESTPLHEAS
jgi:hypothetical protein